MNIIGGATFEGWTSLIGFFMLFFSGYIVTLLKSSTFSWILFFIVAFFGLMLLISIKGILIDLENKRVKPYIHCLFFKLGKWKLTDDVERMVLEYTKEGGRIKYGNMPGLGSIHAEYFSISLRYFSGEKIFIKEFSKYEKAKEFLDTYSELMQVDKVDRYEFMLNEITKLRETL